MTNGPILVALYGTLRRGEPGYRSLGLAEKLRFVSGCRIRGEIVDLGAYPGLIEGDGVVVGELNEIALEATLAELDAFEEFDAERPGDSLFVRRRVMLLRPEAGAFVYCLNTALKPVDPLRIIPSGDWMDRAARAAGRSQRLSV